MNAREILSNWVAGQLNFRPARTDLKRWFKDVLALLEAVEHECALRAGIVEANKKLVRERDAVEAERDKCFRENRRLREENRRLREQQEPCDTTPEAIQDGDDNREQQIVTVLERLCDLIWTRR